MHSCGETIFGLSQKDFRQFAFQPAKQNGIENPISKEREAAGRKWLKRFLSRNPKLSVRTPHGLSFSLAKMFTSRQLPNLNQKWTE
jgi:hypothetical protein